jgi:hypothetical protein
MLNQGFSEDPAIRQLFIERNNIELFLKKASDFFKKMFEEFVSTCNKAKKKDKAKLKEAILKEAEESLVGSKLAVEAMEMYSRQIKKQQVTLPKFCTSQKDYLKDFHLTLVNSLAMISEVSSPNLDRLKVALKSILLLLAEIQVSNEYLLVNHVLFYIENLSFSTSFEMGQHLMLLIFKRLKSEDVINKVRAIDGLRKIISQFEIGTKNLKDENKFRNEITNLLNIIIYDVGEYTFKTFPVEMDNLLNRICSTKQDEDFLLNLIKRLITISLSPISIELTNAFPEETASFKNPIGAITTRFCAKVFESSSRLCDEIPDELYANVIKVAAASLIVFKELAFFDILRFIRPQQFNLNQTIIFNTIGNYTSILCGQISRPVQGTSHLQIIEATSEKFIKSVKGALFDLGGLDVVQRTTEYIKLVCKDVKGQQTDNIGRTFKALLDRVLEKFENINEKILTDFFRCIATLVNSDEVFGEYKQSFIDTLFRVQEQAEMRTLLGYYHTFFSTPTKNKSLKLFLSEMLVSLKDKGMKHNGWPITFELISFVLESFESRSVKELREMKILNTILRVFQLFKMFIKRREENRETALNLHFSSPVLSIKDHTDLKLFCEIVKKFSQIFRNDQDLINDFSDLRGYEKICQDAAYYIETDEDASIVIKFLKEMAYYTDKSKSIPEFNTLTAKVKRFELTPMKIEPRTMSVVGHIEKIGNNKLIRNTMKQGEKLAASHIKDLGASTSNFSAGNDTFILEDIPEHNEQMVLRVPQIIYSIIHYLLDRAPIHDREEFVQDLIHHAEASQENFAKLRDGRIFYTLVYNILQKDGLELEQHTEDKILRLFKRRPTAETYRLLYDHYFTALEKRSTKDYSQLSRLITFEEESQCTFAEYTELTNDKAMQNHYVAIPSLRIYDGRFEKHMNVHIEPLTFSMWLARSKPIGSKARFTIFNLILILNDSHKRKIELYWIGSEIKFKIASTNEKGGSSSNTKDIDERIYPDAISSDDDPKVNFLDGDGRPIHIVLTLDFQNESNESGRLRASLYIDGNKVFSKTQLDLGNLKSSLSKDQKKNTFRAYCSYGYNEPELTKRTDVIETTKIREVFLKKGILKDQEIQLLYAIYTPQSKISVNWFSETHAVNLRNINKGLKDVFTTLQKAGQLKAEELKFPEKPLSIFVRLNTKQFFNDMEFLLKGVPDPRKNEDPKLTELTQKGQVSGTQPSKLKPFLQASHNVAAIMKSQVLTDDDPLLAYLVYFNNEIRTNNTTLIRTAFSSEPNFEFIIRSECILERYLTYFDRASERETQEILQRDGLRTFHAANLTTQYAYYNMSLLLIIQRMYVFPKELLDGLVGLFGIRVKDYKHESHRTSDDKNKESTHILVDPQGICLLFSIFCKNNWLRRLDLLLRKIRTTYLKESLICQ